MHGDWLNGQQKQRQQSLSRRVGRCAAWSRRADFGEEIKPEPVQVKFD